MKFPNLPLRRWPFLAFVLIQALLILMGAINLRPWSGMGRLGRAVDAYGSLTNMIGSYIFFAPPVNAQLFVQIHAPGPPAYDATIGSDLNQESALKLVAIEYAFLNYKNEPLFLELVSRQFFERHPEYKTVVVSLGYYRVPSREAWRNGERVSTRKSLDMTFQRSN